MRYPRIRVFWAHSAVILVFIAGCAGIVNPPTSVPIPTVLASPEAVATTASVENTPTSVPVVDTNDLFHDDFKNPASGWSEEKFDNYFIGYHEPDYYHIEITSPNYKTTVFEPAKEKFADATVEVKVFTVAKKTAPEGDFRYGPVFRRSGDQYYAFTISPRTKKWFALKSSPTALVVLAEGTEESIHDLDTEDILRVDAQGSNFAFYINDHRVGEATDADYLTGEVGFYVETIDSANVHIHFDDLDIRKVEASPAQGSASAVLYDESFTNPASGWPEKKFDNYFIGYHEPEYYHIEITSPNYKTTVFDPAKKSYGDLTVEVKVFTVAKKTATTGDFTYGPVFRRSGDQFYAFTISPRTKNWYVLKSTPSSLSILAQGTEESIHDLDTEDILRVDAQGANFSFHINDLLVGQVTDADYVNGEVGFFVQTFDVTNVHIHFDQLTIRDFEAPPVCDVTTVSINVRSGPSTRFPPTNFLSQGDVVGPLGRSADGTWLKVSLENSNEPGWVFYAPEYLSCSMKIEDLPIINP